MGLISPKEFRALFQERARRLFNGENANYSKPKGYGLPAELTDKMTREAKEWLAHFIERDKPCSKPPDSEGDC